MKKRLLFAALAMTVAMGSFAYEEGDYAFIKGGRVKVTGENLVANGNFAAGLDSWTGATTATPNSSAWTIEPAVGPNGEDVLKSLGVQSEETDNALCQVVSLEPGFYLASFQIQAAGETVSGTTSVGTTVGSNYLDIFLNTDGAKTRAESTQEAPVGAVADAQNFNADWTTVNYYFEVADSASAPTFLVFRLENLATDVQIANVSVNAAEKVYDIRIAERKIAWAETLANIPEFNTADAAGARTALIEETIPVIKEMMETNQLDDPSQAEDIMNGLDAAIETFLDASSKNLKEQITGIDISTLGTAGRGRTITGLGSNGNGVWLEGGNWGRVAPAEGEEDYLMSAIQNGNWTHTAKYCVANPTFPAAKYFFTAEIRNAYTGKSAWPCPGQTFDLNTTCQITLGETTQDIENVVGEEYMRVYIIADITEDGKFAASIYWPGDDRSGSNHGGAFYIRNVEVRTFELDAEAKAAHMAAFQDFIAQYNAAVSARNTIVSMQSDKNYPWNKAALQEALDTYDPAFHITDGWVTADGKDAGVASTDQLNEWAKYQGGEVPEDGKATYYVVRGYQNAINTVRSDNKSISDLSAEITRAYEVAVDGMYSDGNKGELMTSITVAQNTLNDVLADADDSSKEADDATLAEALATLTAAIEAFQTSGSIKPMVDIDFSKGVKTVINEEGLETFVAEGEAGQMTFTAYQALTEENGFDSNTYSFQLGTNNNGEVVLGDVLHVGGDSYGEVILPTPAGSDEVLRMFFDLWFGQLGKAFQYVDLVNAAGERVAGFSIDSYNSNVEYNEFDNEDGTGMVIKGKVKSNHDKSGGAASVCTEALTNKFDLTVNYQNMTVKGTLTNSSNNVVGIEIPMRTDLSDTQITAFRIGGRGHQKANGGAFGRRAWFDNLKIYKYATSGVVGDVQGDGSVNVADISAVISHMAGTENYGAAADVNGDGAVNVADISNIITIMANQ